MKTIKSKIVIVVALFLAMGMLESCIFKKVYKRDSSWSWQQTEEGIYLFLEESEQGVSYSWHGETFDKVAHGNGKLIKSKGQTVISSEDKKAYYGSFDSKGIETLDNGDKYIGNFEYANIDDVLFDDVSDEREISGFGVLIQDIDVYIGNFKNGKPNGSLNQYKYNNIYYSGEWKDGLFNGKGVLYKEDGSQITGIWNEGKIY